MKKNPIQVSCLFFHYFILGDTNLELSSQDIDRSDLSNLKPFLINYFKLCLHHSEL